MKIKTVFTSLVAFLIVTSSLTAQKIERIDPPNWWAGMNYNRVELLLKGTKLSDAVFSTKENGLTIHKVTHPENKNYVYLDVEISEDIKPGSKVIDYKIGRTKYSFKYDINLRNKKAKDYPGLSQNDIIYLITPDRFANGDESNDKVKGMKDKEFDRSSDEARHGGDLAGITSKLDYIKDLGMTATWLNPIEENDQDRASYHGYGFTDHYNVDARFGTNNDYLEYVKQSHERDLKVVKDVVYNHFGINHYLIKDLPSKDWIHNWPEYTQSNYRATTLMDPYASDYDKKKMSEGWFDTSMPDMNQKNEHVSKYLIQNSIWWIENFGIDAFRIDTYAYSDQEFMGKLTKTVIDEYPNFTIFGETWVTGVPTQVWFTSGDKKDKGFDSYMDGITDFNLQYAFMDAVNDETGWNTGLAKIYYTLSWDYQYKNPGANVIFLDNHDVDRFLGVIDNDLEGYKMALGILLTTRGIPQLYYGAEINMDRKGHHGYLREDFSGGWKGDKVDKFTKEGRSAEENATWNYISTISKWRKNSMAISEGKLKQFVPENNLYIYNRYTDDESVLVIANSGKEDAEVNVNTIQEVLKNYSYAINVETGEKVGLDKIVAKSRHTTILELKK